MKSWGLMEGSPLKYKGYKIVNNEYTEILTIKREYLIKEIKINELVLYTPYCVTKNFEFVKSLNKTYTEDLRSDRYFIILSEEVYNENFDYCLEIINKFREEHDKKREEKILKIY